jgi:hypothetical protein
MPHRLPDLHLHPHPTPLHPVANLPIPLPLHRPHARLRPHPDPPTHGSRLVRNMAHSPGRNLERGPDIGQEYPHHLSADSLCCGQRHCWRHDQCRSEILWHVPHAHGRCFGFPDHRRLGCQLFYQADGQALCGHCDLQCNR